MAVRRDSLEALHLVASRTSAPHQVPMVVAEQEA